MSKQSIKQTIDDNIYQNGQQKITGSVMNSVLNEMVDNEYDELTELTSKVDDLDEIVGATDAETEKVESTENGFIGGRISTPDTYGVFQSSSSSPYRTSNLIAVRKGQKFRISGYGTTSVMVLATYSDDISKATDTELTTIGNGQSMEKEVEIPIGVNYIRVVGNINSGLPSAKLITKAGLVEKVESLTTQVDALDGAILESDLTIGGESPNIANPELILPNTLVNNQGLIQTANGWTAIKIPLTQGGYISFGNYVVDRTTYMVFQDVDGVKILGKSVYADAALNGFTLEIPNGAAYIVITINTPTNPTPSYDELMVNYGDALLPYMPYGQGGTEVTKILGKSIVDTTTPTKIADALVPINNSISGINQRLNSISSGGKVGRRRATISFTLDANEYTFAGGADNSAVVSLVNQHGYPCSIAPVRTIVASKKTILDAWKANGNCIVVHSGTSLASTETEESAYNTIKASYDALVDNGYDAEYLVVLQGNMADAFIPIARRFFNYVAGKGNKNGSSSVKCLSIGVDAPMKVWRMSMQTGGDATGVTTLQNMKDAVDEVIASDGSKALSFYGHARNNLISLTDMEALLQYIDGKVAQGLVKVMGVTEQMQDFYAIRWEDVYN